ncbi:hypothetical protein BDP67DRAFT_224845 [Colletotrichum lupini]|nr:hypothetical protein BDP67DRAFT_224845 [Colletotrichum lupini]
MVYCVSLCCSIFATTGAGAGTCLIVGGDCLTEVARACLPAHGSVCMKFARESGILMLTAFMKSVSIVTYIEMFDSFLIFAACGGINGHGSRNYVTSIQEIMPGPSFPFKLPMRIAINCTSFRVRCTLIQQWHHHRAENRDI